MRGGDSAAEHVARAAVPSVEEGRSPLEAGVVLRNLVRVLRQTSKPACQLLMDSCWTGYVKNDVLDISSSDEALQKRAKAKAKPCRLLRPQAPDCLGEVRAFLSLERPIMCPTQHCREKSDSETNLSLINHLRRRTT